MTDNNNRGPYTVEEAKRRTAKSLGCTVQDLENASRMVREADERKRRNSRAWKKIDEIIYLMAEFEYCMAGDIGKVITKLQRFQEEEL